MEGDDGRVDEMDITTPPALSDGDDTSSDDSIDDYLERLPPEVLRSIIRQLSSRPYGDSWQTYVDAWDLYEIFEYGGPLAEVARSEFTAFHTWRLGNGILGGGDVVMDILEIIGHIVQEIGMRADQMEGCLGRHRLVNVRSLMLFEMKVDYNLAEVLETCGANLTKLVLEGQVLSSENIFAVSVFGRRVKDLTLEFERYETLLSEVWISLGPTLEKLCLKTAPVFILFEGELDLNAARLHDSYIHIPVYCANIKSFELQFTKGYGLPAEVIQLLGNRLEVLRLMKCKSCYSPQVLQQILRACPNVRVDVFLNHDISRSLYALGENLRALHIEPSNYLDLGRTESACSKIEELDLEVWQEDPCGFVSAFFASAKPCLRVLNLDMLGDLPLDPCMGALAERVNTVEIFTCATRKISPGMFRGFSAANTKLHTVRVDCYGTRDDNVLVQVALRGGELRSMEDAAVSFVKDFSRCVDLKELVLDIHALPKASKRIEDACVGLRCRRLDISICGVHFFA